MAVHIADSQVTTLLTQYAELTGMSKTESLRRLLTKEVLAAQQKQYDSSAALAFGARLIKSAREKGIQPYSKQEADAMNDLGDVDLNANLAKSKA